MRKITFLPAEEHRDEDLRREEINSKHLPPEVEEKIKPLAKLAFDWLTQKKTNLWTKGSTQGFS